MKNHSSFGSPRSEPARSGKIAKPILIIMIMKIVWIKIALRKKNHLPIYWKQSLSPNAVPKYSFSTLSAMAGHT
jgi:hypothetical protein